MPIVKERLKQIDEKGLLTETEKQNMNEIVAEIENHIKSREDLQQKPQVHPEKKEKITKKIQDRVLDVEKKDGTKVNFVGSLVEGTTLAENQFLEMYPPKDELPRGIHESEKEREIIKGSTTDGQTEQLKPFFQFEVEKMKASMKIEKEKIAEIDQTSRETLYLPLKIPLRSPSVRIQQQKSKMKDSIFWTFDDRFPLSIDEIDDYSDSKRNTEEVELETGCVKSVSSPELKEKRGRRLKLAESIPSVERSRTGKKMKRILIGEKDPSPKGFIPTFSTKTRAMKKRDEEDQEKEIEKEKEKFTETLISEWIVPEDGVIYLHMDNASSHTAAFTREVLEESKIILVPHPPFSPDIAPSDFFLFGYMKSRLRGLLLSNHTELLHQAWSVMRSISMSTRLRVFREWMGRLEQVIESGGEYI
jgi:transposase